MSTRRNVIITISIILLCMLLVTQLVGDPGPSSSAREVALQVSGSDSLDSGDPLDQYVHLTAIVHLNDKELRELESMNAQYLEKRPNLHVDITNYSSSDAYSYLKQHARLGDNPDIMLLDYIWVNEFASAGYLSHQLERYIKVKNGNLDELLQWNNYVWADPYASDPYVAVVNERVLKDEATGLIPSSLSEWMAYQQSRIQAEEEANVNQEDMADMDDIEDDGLQERDTVSTGILYVSPEDPLAFISLIWMLGGGWEQAIGGMPQIAGDSEQLIKQLFGHQILPDDQQPDQSEESDQQELPEQSSKEEAQVPLLYQRQLSNEQMWMRFDAGLLPVLIMRQSELLNQRPRMMEYRYSLVRTDNERRGGWISGTSLAVSATSQHAEEAFQWIDAMTSGMRRADPADAVGQSFRSDPELAIKLGILQREIMALFEESEAADNWNQRLIDSWDRRPR